MVSPTRKTISLPQHAIPRSPAGARIPCAVIVGRPNVGKSSLLNCLARQRIAIVDPTAGVTRDRLSAIVEHEGRFFEIWDTGGIGTPDDLAAEVEAQIEAALARADVVLFVVDAQDGLMPLDESISERLRRISRRVILVANKVDHAKHEAALGEFHRLGFGPPLPISALMGHGRSALLDALAAALPEHGVRPAEPVMKIAIVGRQNVGKSTLINTLAGEERVIVSELPGTTRDAIDVRIERNGRTFLFVDTAGVKRRSRIRDSVEFYSLARAQRAIRRCDVVLFLLDVTAEISQVEKHLAGLIERQCKPCIIVANKWDLAEDRIAPEDYRRYLDAHLPALRFARVSFMSAVTGQNVAETLAFAESLYEQSLREVSTAELNRALRSAVESTPPPTRGGKQPRLFYATQIGTAPPTVLVFVSEPRLITEQYARYLQNRLRSSLPFPDVPIRLLFRQRPRGRSARMAGPA